MKQRRKRGEYIPANRQYLLRQYEANMEEEIKTLMRKNGHIWEQSRVYTVRRKARDNHVDCSTWGTPAWASRETHYAMTQPSDYGGEIFPYFNLVFYYYCNHYRRSLPYKRCANLEFRGRNWLEGGVCYTLPPIPYTWHPLITPIPPKTITSQ